MAGLQQVGIEREHASARRQNAQGLGQRRADVRNVVQDAAEGDAIEGTVRERKPPGVGLDERNPAGPSAGRAESASKERSMPTYPAARSA